MSTQFDKIAEHAAADGKVTAEEVLQLRRECWPDGIISKSEAEAIFSLNDKLAERGPEWTDFFVEALSVFTVMQLEPKGYVSDENAEWLKGRIDHDGVLGSMAECELVMKIFERARNVPQSMKDWVIDRMEHAVLEGTGPTRDGGQLEKGNVNAAEASLLRRAIFAPASERPGAVGRSEADLLFRLKDATLGADNAPEWKQLFVQGVGNYLQGYHLPNAQISRERAAELDIFMSDTSRSVGRFIGRMAKASPNVFGQVFGKRKTPPAMEERALNAQQVDSAEQAWLDGKIHADGQVDEYEQALLDFLAQA